MKGFVCCFFTTSILVSTTISGFAQKRVADLLLHNVAVIDVKNAKTIAHQSVLISGDSILAIGDLSLEKNYRAKKTIDLSGKFIMPSLWDMHVHFGGDTLVEENKNLLPLYLANGITAVRDCAGDISTDVLKWKKQIKAGTLAGPDIFTSGPKLEGLHSIWPGDLEIDDEAALKSALDSLQKLQVDFIKITDNALKPSLFLESIRQAKKRGWKTSGHAPVSLTLQELSDAGLSTIEHLGYMLRVVSSEEAGIAAQRATGKLDNKQAAVKILETQDTVGAVKKIKLLAANGTAVVPTIFGSYITTYLDKNNHAGDANLKYLGPALKRTYNWRVERAAKDDAAAIAFRHRQFEATASLLPLIHRSGMTILAGTDVGFLNSFNYPGFGLHDELEMMVQYGLSAQTALAASVINGPAFLGLEKKYGAVAKGKSADLLLLNKNPLLDITHTRSIAGLIRRGVYMGRAELDQLLVVAAQQVSDAEQKEQLK
jgi:imidazolonepropionase-like amidohydrolase